MKEEEFFIETRKGTVYAKSWSSNEQGTQPVLLMLHDSLGCVKLWREFAKHLAESTDHRVIAYDRPGYGRSEAVLEMPALNFIEAESQESFQEVLNFFEIDQFIVIGHSVGGSMGICIAATQPGCQGVVSISAQTFVEKRTHEGLIEAMKRFSRPGQLDKLIRYHGDKANWVLQSWLETWLNKKFETWNLSGVLVNVKVPILAIHGEDDEYGSVAFVDFMEKFAGSQVRKLIIRDCGHMPHREHEEVVLNEIRDFLPILNSRSQSV